MPSHSGTNLVFTNALDKIKSFLLNSSALWECVGDTKVGEAEYSASAYEGGTGTGARTIYFKCTGYDGLSEGYFAVYSLNSGSSYYAIAARGIAQYVEGYTFAQTVGGLPYCSNPVYMLLNQTECNYYITGDERKIYFLANPSGNPQMLGMGMFLPSGTPEEYPQPLFVGGSAGSLLLPTTIAAGNGDKGFFSPSSGGSYSTLAVLSPAGAWYLGANHGNSDSFTSYTGASNAAAVLTLPYTCKFHSQGAFDARAFGSTDIPMFPIELSYRRTAPDRTDNLGEFHDLFYVSGGAGTPIAVEDTITDENGGTYIVWRHTNLQSFGAFCAVKMLD